MHSAHFNLPSVTHPETYMRGLCRGWRWIRECLICTRIYLENANIMSTPTRDGVDIYAVQGEFLGVKNQRLPFDATVLVCFSNTEAMELERRRSRRGDISSIYLMPGLCQICPLHLFTRLLGVSLLKQAPSFFVFVIVRCES